MSEQNILNPTVTSPLNPDYSIKITDPQVVTRWQARSGKPFFRRLAARGYVIEMTWKQRLMTDYLTLQQWYYQYENDYFTFADWDRSRYYTGMFADQPTWERVGFNQVTITAQFVVVPTLPMFQYPSNWAQDAIFLEERAGFGDLVKLTGNTINYMDWSESFDNWSLDGDVTVTPNNQPDPNGQLTADTITTGATAGKGVFRISGLAAANGSQVTLSVWLKAAANTAATLGINRADGLGSDQESTPITVTNGWQRFTFTHSAVWTGAQNAVAIIHITNASTSIFAWGAQLESGSVATPYVQTNGSISSPFARWDRLASNYLQYSEQFDNAVWGREANVTVTPNNQTDPNGGSTADTITTGATAAVGVYQYSSARPTSGLQMTFSVWLKAAGNTSVTLLIDRVGVFDLEQTTVTVTNAWQRFTFTHSGTWTATDIAIVFIRIANASTSIFAWGAQFEYGAGATTYAQSTSLKVDLSAANSSANLHGGFAYFNTGTIISDAAEWSYLGYGFQLYAYKGPGMGITQVWLDGVLLGTVDLYAAVPTASAVVWTQTNVALGIHRVKLMPTNTKNGSSVGFVVCADAIQVMR